MGKQRKKKAGTERPPSVNSIDWEHRTLELVRAGLVPTICLDSIGYITIRNTDRSNT